MTRHPFLLLAAATVLVTALVGLPTPGRAADSVTPLTRAHAHNDYLHPRPLADALDHGFCSVEADIYLVDGELLVAHDRDKVKPERTLERLYLQPLRERARANGGSIYPKGPQFWLLIDLKTGAEETYPPLQRLLARYRDLLSGPAKGRTERRGVRVVLSGSMSTPAGRKLLEADQDRLAAQDGRPADLGGTAPSELVPWISASWSALFTWKGEGPFPPTERQRLKEMVQRAHGEGRKVRFWATPEQVEFWREMVAVDVDLINTDRLSELRKFLTTP